MGRWTGSWMSGTQAAAPDLRSAYPGERFGRPRSGPGSIAPFGARLVALLIDWFAAWAVTTLATGDFRSSGWHLLVFFASYTVLTMLTGQSFGMRLRHLRVESVDGRPLAPGWQLARSVLLCLVVPPLLTDGDARGMHDRAAGAVVARV